MTIGQGKKRGFGKGRAFLIAVAVVGAVYGVTLYAESFLAPAHCCLATWPTPNPVQAERLVDRLDPKGQDPDAQERAARLVLASRPVDPTGWLRLAYADSLRNGRLTPQGLYAFKTSYTMAAYAGKNAGFRAYMAFQHWDQLDPDTRKQVILEIQVLRRDGPHLDSAKAQIDRVTNLEGRQIAGVLRMLPEARPTP